MRRTKLREHIFQIIFEMEFNSPDTFDTQAELHFELNDVGAEDDRAYIREKAAAIIAAVLELDRRIDEVCVGWKTKRMSRVDLSILRLAFYEILKDPSVPESVAINEAVELAKRYSSDSGPAFINGVLARLVNRGDTPGNEND